MNSTIGYVLQYHCPDRMPEGEWVDGGSEMTDVEIAANAVATARSAKSQKVFKAEWRVVLRLLTETVLDL